MRFQNTARLLVGAWALTALLLGSCGKSEEKGSDEPVSLSDIARMAAGGVAFEDESASIERMIEAAGFKKKIYEAFPGQQLGWKGRVLVYGGKKGKPPGGIIYVTREGSEVSPRWHWYFDDVVPDSVVPVELNDDGLWDVRVVAGERVVSFTQDETFSLTANERADWIALNGVSSPPVSPGDALWRVFDGDTASAWRSPLDESGKAFLELVAPFGITEGILTLRTMSQGQPKNCTLYGDGAEIQRFELEAKAAAQVLQLDRGIVGAKQIRIEFTSTHDNAAVEIAELELR